MNRYGSTAGGSQPSKASSTTTCQKCLKKGHYSYECKASVQSRPYVSRPSRSQQLQNPRLKPRLNEAKLAEPTLDPVHKPSPTLIKPVEAGTPRDSTRQDQRLRDKSTRDDLRRSPSSLSDSSVSTISTGRAISPAPSMSPPGGRRPTTRSPDHAETLERHRKRSSRSRSPRNTRSSRPDNGRVSYRSRSPDDNRTSSRVNAQIRHSKESSARRERSLSPFSRRLALTQAMNSG